MHIAKCLQVFGVTVTFQIPHILINTQNDIILALGITVCMSSNSVASVRIILL